MSESAARHKASDGGNHQNPMYIVALEVHMQFPSKSRALRYWRSWLSALRQAKRVDAGIAKE